LKFEVDMPHLLREIYSAMLASEAK